MASKVVGWVRTLWGGLTVASVVLSLVELAFDPAGWGQTYLRIEGTLPGWITFSENFSRGVSSLIDLFNSHPGGATALIVWALGLYLVVRVRYFFSPPWWVGVAGFLVGTTSVWFVGGSLLGWWTAPPGGILFDGGWIKLVRVGTPHERLLEFTHSYQQAIGTLFNGSGLPQACRISLEEYLSRFDLNSLFLAEDFRVNSSGVTPRANFLARSHYLAWLSSELATSTLEVMRWTDKGVRIGIGPGWTNLEVYVTAFLALLSQYQPTGWSFKIDFPSGRPPNYELIRWNHWRVQELFQELFRQEKSGFLKHVSLINAQAGETYRLLCGLPSNSELTGVTPKLGRALKIHRQYCDALARVPPI